MHIVLGGRLAIALIAAALIAAACGPSGPSPSPSPEATTAALPSPIAPAPSPTAPPVTRVAYAVFQAPTGRSTVFTVLPNGSGLKKLLPGDHGMPRWSPDGQWIAVSSFASGVFETIVRADGSKARDLKTPASLSLTCTSWTPDGQRLLCEGWSASQDGREGIYTVSAANGGGLKRLTTPTDGVHDLPGAYSPDGTRIVFVRATYPPERHGQLWVCDADGGNAHKLVDMLVGYRVDWSPDGRWIVGDVAGSLILLDLTSLGQEPRKITIKGGSASNARWSPDGTRIVFEFLPRGSRAAEIYSVAVDGSNARRITNNSLPDQLPDWGMLTR